MPPTRGISCLSLVLYGIRIGGHSRLYMYSEERERATHQIINAVAASLPTLGLINIRSYQAGKHGTGARHITG